MAINPCLPKRPDLRKCKKSNLEGLVPNRPESSPLTSLALVACILQFLHNEGTLLPWSYKDILLTKLEIETKSFSSLWKLIPYQLSTGRTQEFFLGATIQKQKLERATDKKVHIIFTIYTGFFKNFAAEGTYVKINYPGFLKHRFIYLFIYYGGAMPSAVPPVVTNLGLSLVQIIAH